MDLRVVKTEKVIREAFLDLRREKPLEKVTVRELCEKALINKATFYKHYADVYDLSDKLEDEFVAHLIDVEGWDSLFQDPDSLLSNLHAIVAPDRMEDMVLFRDRLNVFWTKASKEIIEHYREAGEEQYATSVLFVMGGLSFTRILFDDNEEDMDQKETLMRTVVSCIRAIGQTLPKPLKPEPAGQSMGQDSP